MLGDLGTLQTPSRRSEFIIDSVTLDRVKVAVGDTTLVIPKGTFEAVLDYLHLNHHHAGIRVRSSLITASRTMSR